MISPVDVTNQDSIREVHLPSPLGKDLERVALQTRLQRAEDLQQGIRAGLCSAFENPRTQTLWEVGRRPPAAACVTMRVSKGLVVPFRSNSVGIRQLVKNSVSQEGAKGYDGE